jgi:hypothetical protein
VTVGVEKSEFDIDRDCKGLSELLAVGECEREIVVDSVLAAEEEGDNDNEYDTVNEALGFVGVGTREAVVLMFSDCEALMELSFVNVVVLVMFCVVLWLLERLVSADQVPDRVVVELCVGVNDIEDSNESLSDPDRHLDSEDE